MESRICPTCGKKNNPELNKCWNCGYGKDEVGKLATDKIPKIKISLKWKAFAHLLLFSF